MPRSFDFLAADDNPAASSNDWRVQAAFVRCDAASPAALTDLRTTFLCRFAIEDANKRNQGPGRPLPASAPSELLKLVDGSRREAADVLPCLPRYSARLLLKFKLRTPLLTRDDDPFHLFDNPVRKDHLLGVPYLAAASAKGLAADAYQRAFPPAQPWKDLGRDNHERAHAFRLADPAALRLFGLADDGADTGAADGSSRIGRLHFSPVWFEQVEYLVMNPGNPAKAIGTLPIQFEAIARGQKATLELVYANPHGTRDDDERTVRADLARLLAALGHWWPALGIGAKRLAGYGAIEVTGVELQTLGWETLPELKVIAGPQSAAAPAAVPEPAVASEPPNYTLFVQGGALLDADAEAARKRINRLVQDEIDRAEAALKVATGNDKAPARKNCERLKKNQDDRRAELKKHHARAVAYFEAHGAAPADTDDTESVSSVTQATFEPVPVHPLAHLSLEGESAWCELATRLAALPEESR